MADTQELYPGEREDAALFWNAYGADMNTWDLASIGDRLDERITAIRSTFDMDKPLRGLGAGALHAFYALEDARRHIDHAYGNLTGFQRNGCGGGMPLRYKNRTVRF